MRQNDDMRRISVWVAIWAVPTLLAGIYGRNFRHLPELEWAFGYPMVLVVMALIYLQTPWSACSLPNRIAPRKAW